VFSEFCHHLKCETIWMRLISLRFLSIKNVCIFVEITMVNSSNLVKIIQPFNTYCFANI
jgi:hypothetical protein